MYDHDWFTLCCRTEINTALQSNYIPIKKILKTARDDKFSRALRQRIRGAAWIEQSKEASQEATGPRPAPRMKRSRPHGVLVEGEPRKGGILPAVTEGQADSADTRGGLPGVSTIRSLGGGS